MVEFNDARRKVERAHAHIREIETRLKHLHESSVSRIDVDPRSRSEILVHDLTDSTAFDDLALPLGDAVHNLNCALDYIWLHTIKTLMPSLVDDRAKMPVRKYAKEVEGWLAKAGIKTTSNLFRFIVSEIKPHSGGNDAIWAIHNFDIRDKHRLLIPVLSQGWITGIVVMDQYGERWQGIGSTVEFQRPPYVIQYQPGLHVKEKGELTVEIVVNEDKSGCEMSIPEELSAYAKAVSHTVELFTRFLKVETGS